MSYAKPDRFFDDGLIYLSTPAATVGLVVRHGRIVEAPPYAKRWALGKHAVTLWRMYSQHPSNQLVWLPDSPAPAIPSRLHITRTLRT